MAVSHRRTGTDRPRVSGEQLLAAGDTGEGAFRLMRTRDRLTDEGRARLESEIARLLEELADPEALLVDLMLIGMRQV